MRILHVIPQFPYFGGRTIIGGHASCLLALALAQHSAGDDVSILSYIEGYEGWRSIDDGPSVFSLFPGRRAGSVTFGIKFCRAVLEWVRQRESQFDVVHVHSGFADYLVVSCLLKKVVGKPVLHTMYCPIPTSGGRWRLPVVHATLKKSANRLDWCGGISQNVVESLLAYGIRAAQRIRPALDIGRFRSNAPDIGLRGRLGLREDDFVVLFVGNAKPQKNAYRVLLAIQEIRRHYSKVRLVITTELKQSSSDADLEALRTVINALDLGSCVVHLGIVDNMPALMKASDVLVAPFLDTFGPSDYFMAALEAMACGIPVVVSAVGGMPEIVSKDVGRLVDPSDPQSIAQGLLDFLSDKELRIQAGKKAQLLVEKMFDPRAAVYAYRPIYEGACDKRNGFSERL